LEILAAGEDSILTGHVIDVGKGIVHMKGHEYYHSLTLEPVEIGR
jgi:hypothetical protein